MLNKYNKQIWLETEINIKYNELIFISDIIKSFQNINIDNMNKEQKNEIYTEYYILKVFINNIRKYIEKLEKIKKHNI